MFKEKKQKLSHSNASFIIEFKYINNFNRID